MVLNRTIIQLETLETHDSTSMPILKDQDFIL